MIRRGFPLLLCLLTLSLLMPSLAEETEAENIVKKCTVAVSSSRNLRSHLYDKGYIHCWKGKPGDTITVTTPKGTMAQGIQVAFHAKPVRLTVTCDGETLGVWDWDFYTNYLPFSRAVDHFTITIDPDAEANAEISQLCVVSEGTLPDWVQQWQYLTEPADLMLVATHPDDELLWFGGMLPTYAGEQKKRVIVVYTSANTNYRRNELLAGLWACGVRYYPEIGTFPDRNSRSVALVRKVWGETAPEEYITAMLKKYHPQVVVTQDINGEYGHPHHRVTVAAVINAVEALNQDVFWVSECQSTYGTLRPAKLYLHLWEENTVTYNWRVPLEAFGSKTSLEVTRAAFRQHVSQQKGKYHVLDYGKLSSTEFGLYWSAVGVDEAGQDLFEHLE